VVTAPAAHLVGVRAADGGLLVGHTACSGPWVFVPNMPGQDHALAIDIAQAIIAHQCPPGEGDHGQEAERAGVVS
jgi:hypothetical protein